MDLNPTPTEQHFRDEFRAWLHSNIPESWDPSGFHDEDSRQRFEFLRAWQKKMHAAGWVGIHWPKEYGGRGATLIEQLIFHEELEHARAPHPANVLGLIMAGPVIMHWGTEEQKKRYLPKILSGEELWCEGLSEPGSGSDLASLQTRAVEDGDH